MFRLHDRLSADTSEITRLQLSRVLLMEDARYPWLILVPQREGITEIHQLWDADQQLLWGEIAQVSRALRQASAPDKLNVAALGNVDPQLHIHVVARFRGDAAWPGLVWGSGQAETYEDEARAVLIGRLREGIEAVQSPA